MWFVVCYKSRLLLVTPLGTDHNVMLHWWATTVLLVTPLGTDHNVMLHWWATTVLQVTPLGTDHDVTLHWCYNSSTSRLWLLRVEYCFYKKWFKHCHFHMKIVGHFEHFEPKCWTSFPELDCLCCVMFSLVIKSLSLVLMKDGSKRRLK